MDLNYIYEMIVELGGDCFNSKNRPPCNECPFKDKCLVQMISLAKVIPKEQRIEWALDKLVEDIVLDEKDK